MTRTYLKNREKQDKPSGLSVFLADDELQSRPDVVHSGLRDTVSRFMPWASAARASPGVTSPSKLGAPVPPLDAHTLMSTSPSGSASSRTVSSLMSVASFEDF